MLIHVEHPGSGWEDPNFKGFRDSVADHLEERGMSAKKQGVVLIIRPKRHYKGAERLVHIHHTKGSKQKQAFLQVVISFIRDRWREKVVVEILEGDSTFIL